MEAYWTKFEAEWKARRTAARIGAESTGSVLPQDSLALVALYYAMDGPNWTTKANWLTGPVHTWEGVEAIGDRVTGIELISNGLKGSIPEKIGDLTGLVSLKLRAASFDGPLPSTIGNLSRLEVLWLFGTNLEGPLPAEIGLLHALVVLDMGIGSTLGPLPPELGNLSQLEWLSIGATLGGTIPASLGNLKQLRVLQFNRCGLEGSIPEQLGTLPNLEILGLQHNNLTGPIPDLLWSNTKLFDLTLYYNQLTGELSRGIGALTNMYYFALNNNKLTGTIPSELANFGITETISLANNNLDGMEDLSGMPHPEEYFEVDGNWMTFEDIEPNLSLLTRYAPQALVGEPRSENLREGDPLELHIPVGGEHNRYQWYRDGSPVPGATSETYLVEHATADDAGEYTLVVTNDVVTGLTLESHPVTVSVEAPAGVDLVLRRLALKPNGNLVAKIEWNAERFASDRVDVYLSQAPALPNPLGSPLKRIQNEGRYVVKLRSGKNDVYYVQVCAKPRTVCSEVVQLDFSTARLADEGDEDFAAQGEAEVLGSYPNPFNPQTTIRYALSEPQAVRLSIYDATGRRVAVLVDRMQAAGMHEAAFEASRLPSGTYFGRLEAGSVRQTFRLFLVK